MEGMGAKKFFGFFYFGWKAKNFSWNFSVANPSPALRATLTKLDLYPSKVDTHSSIILYEFKY